MSEVRILYQNGRRWIGAEINPDGSIDIGHVRIARKDWYYLDGYIRSHPGALRPWRRTGHVVEKYIRYADKLARRDREAEHAIKEAETYVEGIQARTNALATLEAELDRARP